MMIMFMCRVVDTVSAGGSPHGVCWGAHPLTPGSAGPGVRPVHAGSAVGGPV